MADGVFFAEPDHPVCQACVSSLSQEESCPECGGDGWIFDDDDAPFECVVTTTCPECGGEPAKWFCPTCRREWKIGELWPPHCVR